METLAIIEHAAAPELPLLIADAGEDAAWRFVEFFTVNIRNKNTRWAYYKAACRSRAGVRGEGCSTWPA